MLITFFKIGNLRKITAAKVLLLFLFIFCFSFGVHNISGSRDKDKNLKEFVKSGDKNNQYGEFLKWNDATKIFKKFDKAKIIDFDTGKSFYVQRRAGNKHADVQPLTAEDTTVMKAVFQGNWTWKRRAILVEIRGHRIAASMNGMPHGAGAIKGNNFRGHFCIHFRDSKTHSNNKDLAHQLMVWKAAGKTEEMVKDCTPEKIAILALTSIKQGDVKLVEKFLTPGNEHEKYETGELINSLESLSFSAHNQSKENTEQNRFDYKVSYWLKDGASVRNKVVTVTLVKTSGNIPWKVRRDCVYRMLGKWD